MFSLCHRFNRHKLHLITYGLVALALMVFGLVFSGFAVFHKNSQIGKVWLAGPTTIVVGLVLCGKVMIDWGPAQLHSDSSSESGEEEQTLRTTSERNQEDIKSIDAQYIKQKREDGLLLVNEDVDFAEKAPCYSAAADKATAASFDQSTGGGSMMFGSRRASQHSRRASQYSRRASQYSQRPSASVSTEAVQQRPPHCSQIHMATISASDAQPTCSNSSTLLRANHAVTFDPRIPNDANGRPRSWSHSATAAASALEQDCHCSFSTTSMYGSIGQTRPTPPQRLIASSSMQMHSPLYQGEMFVLRDRQYLI
uniref:Membrane-associated protein n=1 Tax=Plectus sambesii TaxID=2011161 RepID=A0A914UZ71_9BILA